jgi:hypothetical protein
MKKLLVVAAKALVILPSPVVSNDYPELIRTYHTGQIL